jgi:hypothetical protein
MYYAMTYDYWIRISILPDSDFLLLSVYKQNMAMGTVITTTLLSALDPLSLTKPASPAETVWWYETYIQRVGIHTA